MYHTSVTEKTVLNNLKVKKFVKKQTEHKTINNTSYTLHLSVMRMV